jgi:transcriptional regulator with XRE-family HTH domain
MKDRIKQTRELANLSQRAFAQRIGISGPSVARLESGENNPGEQTIRAICSEFGVRREWLELGIEPMRAADFDDYPETLVPDLVETLSAYPAVLNAFRRIVNHMTPADWDRLNQLLDDVVNEKDPQA